MTADLVGRLRAIPNFNTGKLAHEAADELERLRADPRHLRAILGDSPAAKLVIELEQLRAEAERLRADAAIGRLWREDSSLATWFPFTAEELTRLQADDKRNRAMLFTLNDAVERLRADAARLTAAASMTLEASSRMTAFGDGRAYFESGDAVNAFRSALRALDAASTPNTKDQT